MAEVQRVIELGPSSPISTSLRDFLRERKALWISRSRSNTFIFPISPEDAEFLQFNCPFKRTKFTETFMDLPGYPLAKINYWLTRKESEKGAVCWSLKKPTMVNQSPQIGSSADLLVSVNDEVSNTEEILAAINSALHMKLHHLSECCLFIGELRVIQWEFKTACTNYAEKVFIGKDDFYSIATLELCPDMDDWTLPNVILDFLAKPLELAPVRSKIIEEIFLHNKELYSELIRLQIVPNVAYNSALFHSQEPPFSTRSQFVLSQTKTLEQLNAEIEELNQVDTDDEDEYNFLVRWSMK